MQVLSKTLARVKSDKQREVEQLEEGDEQYNSYNSCIIVVLYKCFIIALLQSEAKNQHRMRSPSELRYTNSYCVIVIASVSYSIVMHAQASRHDMLKLITLHHTIRRLFLLIILMFSFEYF